MAEKFGAGSNLDEASVSNTASLISLKHLSVPHWHEGRRKEKHNLREEIQKILMEPFNKHCNSAGFCVSPFEGWAFSHYFKCFLYSVNTFYTGLSGESSIGCVLLLINDGNLYKKASDITVTYLKNGAKLSSHDSWSSCEKCTNLGVSANSEGKIDIHRKQKITWTYPNNKMLVLLKGTICDVVVDVVIIPSSRGSEGSFPRKKVCQPQTEKKCCFTLTGNIKAWKGLENQFNHQFKPKHIVCPYGEKAVLLIFDKKVDIKTLQSDLKQFKVEQLQPEEVKFLVPDGLVERACNADLEKILSTDLEEVSGVDVTIQDNKMCLTGSTTHQLDIAKHYLKRFENWLNIMKNVEDNIMSSYSLDEKWDNQIDTIQNVSEMEFKALLGIKRLKHVQLSWNGDAILIDGPATNTSVLTDITNELMVLRSKQSVEIALDEEEKKIVKDVIMDIQSEDTLCIYDENKSLVALYSDTQDNIMKFKHKLNIQTGKLKENVRSSKRFAENTHLLERSRQNLSFSLRSANIGQDCVGSMGVLHKAEFQTNEKSIHSSVRPKAEQDFALSKGAQAAEVFYTKENIKVAVYRADILNLSVACIVNAANDTLQHGGGVAKVIADAAGPKMVQEGDVIIKQLGRIQVGCQVTTSAGKLPYSCVIHTVGPCWSDYQPHDLKKVQECEEDLYAAIYGCFTEAERKGLSTIALPAVSSGIYAVPQEMCAVQYAKAVIDYSRQSRQGQALKEIHFIDKIPDLIRLIQETFRTLIQEGKIPNYNIHNYVASSSRHKRKYSGDTGIKGHRKQVVTVDKCHYDSTKPNGLSPVCYEQGEKDKRQFVFQVSVKPVLCIYEGNILEVKHINAIVCPDDSRGSGRGRIAAGLKKNTKYRQTKDMCFKQQKPSLGDLVLTVGEETPFNVIVHVVIEKKYSGRQELRSAIKKSFDNILRQMNERENVKTIAIPLFGVKCELLTEKLWAESFLERFVAFCCEVRNPNLEEVHIITHVASSSIYSTLKRVFIEFTDKLNKTPSDQKGSPPRQPPSLEIYKTCDDSDDPMSGHGCDFENSEGDTDCCTICMCPKIDPKSLSCGHSFCSECHDQMLKHKPVCAVCGRIVGIITGNQPDDGRMEVRDSAISLAGYEGHGCIEITYAFPAGKQGPGHPSPGKLYSKMTRTAYLPNTAEGKNVCRLLKLAFDRRLVFTISQSRTTGKEGLTWNDIHHKTNPKPGQQFGYPDPEYLTRLKDELSAKGVTEADLPPE